jgi:genome maintenance exonuclease 1
MHKYLERYILEGVLPEPGSNPYSHESHKMAKEIITHGFTGIEEVWGVEVNLYYPDLYAGTTDCCGIHFGEEAILDYKQSNRVKCREQIDDYFIQLTSYMLAHNKLYGTNIRKGVILMCVKPEEIKPGVFGAPQYLEFILERNEFDKYADMWWTRVEQYYSA